MKKYDVIVIGAGLGGLVSAAVLAKLGKKKVLVLEQHYIPGGCATVFERHGVTCEVGLHEMDMGAVNRDMKHTIFKKLELDTRVPWVDLPETWRMKIEDGEEYVIPHGRKAAIDYLISRFPHEKRGIKKYFAAMAEVSYSIRRFPFDLKFWDFFFFPITSLWIHVKNYFEKATVSGKLNKWIKDEKLKTLLNVNLAYYDDNPDAFSWYYHSAAQNSYYNSARFIKGGSQKLSDTLVEIIKENGGEVKLFCEAKKILLDGKKARGVVWYDRKEKQEEQALANKIIANCSPQVTYEELLPAELDDVSRKKLVPSTSLYTVYIIFKQKFSQMFPGNTYSTFISGKETSQLTMSENFKQMREANVEDRSFVLVDYSTIDSGLVKEGDARSFGVLTSISYLSDWDGLSIEAYRAKKDRLAHVLFDRMEKTYPGFKSNVDFYEVSTPKTIQRYLHCPAGTAYGYVQRGYLMGRADTVSPTVKNLHFASAWTNPGGGFTGAIIGGYYTGNDLIFPIKWRVVLRTLLCTAVGTTIGTAHHWIHALMAMF